jgi:hypothetical protein
VGVPVHKSPPAIVGPGTKPNSAEATHSLMIDLRSTGVTCT